MFGKKPKSRTVQYQFALRVRSRQVDFTDHASPIGSSQYQDSVFLPTSCKSSESGVGWRETRQQLQSLCSTAVVAKYKSSKYRGQYHCNIFHVIHQLFWHLFGVKSSDNHSSSSNYELWEEYLVSLEGRGSLMKFDTSDLWNLPHYWTPFAFVFLDNKIVLGPCLPEGSNCANGENRNTATCRGNCNDFGVWPTSTTCSDWESSTSSTWISIGQTEHGHVSTVDEYWDMALALEMVDYDLFQVWGSDAWWAAPWQRVDCLYGQRQVWKGQLHRSGNEKFLKIFSRYYRIFFRGVAIWNNHGRGNHALEKRGKV